MLMNNIYLIHEFDNEYLIINSPTTATLATKDSTTLLEENKEDKMLTNTNIYEETVNLLNNKDLIQVEITHEILPNNNYTVEQIKSINEFFYSIKDFNTYVPIEIYNNPSKLLELFYINTDYIVINLQKKKKEWEK